MSKRPREPEVGHGATESRRVASVGVVLDARGPDVVFSVEF